VALQHLPLVLRQQRCEDVQLLLVDQRPGLPQGSSSMLSALRSPSKNFANSRSFGESSATRS
jgi:hypothetical protein